MRTLDRPVPVSGTDFNVVEAVHDGCPACAAEAVSAATYAAAVGAVGCTHSTNATDPANHHGATVRRARCSSRRSAANGGDCCCSICRPDHRFGA